MDSLVRSWKIHVHEKSVWEVFSEEARCSCGAVELEGFRGEP